MSNITGNTWEWSELYALAFILSYWWMYGADDNQNRLSDLFYRVLNVFLEGNRIDNWIEYKISSEGIEIYQSNTLIDLVNKKDIEQKLELFYSDLINGNEWRAFSLSSWDELIQLLKISWIKASSRNKNDIDLILLDKATNVSTPKLWFTIKSQLGTPSTMLNASMATNFIYEVLDQYWNTPKITDLPNLVNKDVKGNTMTLLNAGLRLQFRNIQSDVFTSNLQLIDSLMPQILSEMLLVYYSKWGTTIRDISEKLFNENSQKTHKVKEFLYSMTLWMVPNSEWNGILSALGWMILVKKDGDVLCYYIYNLEKFQNYLYNNLKFDTPSTSRYWIWSIIENNGRLFFKLNMQIRFTR